MECGNMAKTTVMIKEIITKVNIYSVGAVPNGLESKVDKIKFHGKNDLYNKGYQYDDSCYIVFFANNTETRKIIPCGQILEITIDKQDHDVVNYETTDL